MTEIKFDETQEYNETHLDVIKNQAETLLKKIANYRECIIKNPGKNVPNVEKKYIKYEGYYTTHFMYVESQSIDKWTRCITLIGPEFHYYMSDNPDYQEHECFAYYTTYNLCFNCNDFVEDYKNGVIKEIDREEFEFFFKEATEWALENGLSLFVNN